MDSQSLQTDLSKIFAPEQFLHTTSFAEAVEACETTFRYTRQELPVVQLSLDADLRLHIGSNSFDLTEKAFGDLCAIVKVPATFAKDIPPDLASIIVERLKTVHQETAVLAHRDGVVVGIINPKKWEHKRKPHQPDNDPVPRPKIPRPHYQPVPYRQLMQVIKNIWTDSTGDSRITLADSGMSIEIVGRSEVVGPQPGDITGMGLAVTGSETGGPVPHARGFTLRLVCTNGAVLPNEFRHVGFNTDWRVSFARRVDAFGAALAALSSEVVDWQKNLQQTYDRLATEPLSDLQFFNLYRQTRYVYRLTLHSDEEADRALNVQPEKRRKLISNFRDRQEELRSLVGTGIVPPPQLTDLLAWDVFNAITAQARDEKVYPRRIALEGLGGAVLHAFMPESMN